MLSLDLFDSRYEKRLHEGAVDDAEYARLKKLGEKIDYLKQARAKTKDADMHRAIDQRIQKYDDERREILSVRGMNEVEQPQRPPAKGLLKGKDLVTPQQRVAGATTPKPGVMGAVKDVVGGIKRFVKGEPDQGPTYEDELQEQEDPQYQGIPGYQVYQQLLKHWDDKKPYATVILPNNEKLPITRNMIFNVLFNLKNATDAEFKKVLAGPFTTLDKFMLWSNGIKRYQLPVEKPESPPGQMTLPLKEKAGQKKKFKSAEIKDTQLARALQKARARFPTAASDMEAFAKDQQATNDEQDTVIGNLKQEIDQVQASNNQLTQNLRQVNQQLQQVSTRAPATTPAVTAPTAPAAAPSAEKPFVPGMLPPIIIQAPERMPEKDQVIYQQVKDLETELKGKIDAMATWNQVAQKDPDAENELTILRKDMERTRRELERKIKKLQKSGAPIQTALPAKQSGMTYRALGKPTTPGQTLARNIRAQQKTEPLPTGDTETLTLIDPAQLGSLARTSTSDMARVEEHGGGIGPKKHWQSLMREGEMKNIDIMRQDLDLMSDVQFLRVHGMSKAAFQQKYRTLLKPTSQHDVPMEGTPQQFGQAVRMAGYAGRELEKDSAYKKSVQHARQEREQSQQNIQRVKQGYGEEPEDYRDLDETFDMPGTTVPRKSIIQGYTIFFNPETRVVSVTRGGDSEEAAIEQQRIGTVNLKTFRQAAERLIDKIESDELLNETIKDTASATAVIACLLVGGTLQGCATNPQQTTAQQVLKTGQDAGRAVQTAKKITRAGAEEEVNQELKNFVRATSGDPGAQNTSNILRLWKRLMIPRPRPPQQPEPPEYGPPQPTPRMPQYESKEISNKADYFKAIDSIDRQLKVETNPVNKQILKTQRNMLTQRAQAQGWIPRKELREDTAALAAEQAILKRIFVKHRDLMMEYGPDKITQAAESVAYNVGDIAHITDEQITEWVGQVKQILGTVAESTLEEKWSAKYKKSINCANPKGFSQRAHCQGRKK